MILILFSLALASGPCKSKDPNLDQFKAVADKIKEQQLVELHRNYPWLLTNKKDSKRYKVIIP